MSRTHTLLLTVLSTAWKTGLAASNSSHSKRAGMHWMIPITAMSNLGYTAEINKKIQIYAQNPQHEWYYQSLEWLNDFDCH